MAILNKINVSGTTYDINDERLTENAGTIQTSENLAVGGKITGGEIVETMTGYSYSGTEEATMVYVSICKNGNKLTMVLFGTYTSDGVDADIGLGYFDIPASVGAQPKNAVADILKGSNTRVFVNIKELDTASLSSGSTYIFRIEATFLLSENLID